VGAAIGTSFDVQFTVEVVKGKKINWPRLENQQYIMSIGSTPPLLDALRRACSDMIDWLATDYGYDKIHAYRLLGQTAEIKVANVVDPTRSTPWPVRSTRNTCPSRQCRKRSIRNPGGLRRPAGPFLSL